MHEVILVGVDGSPGGYAAVAEAAELARRFNARLVAISVEEGLPRHAATIDQVDEVKHEKDRYYNRVGAEAKRIAGKHGAKLEHEIRLGHAADVIVRFADEVDTDLLVMGYKGHSRLAQFMIGTTAQKVNTCSPASVLIVKAPRSIRRSGNGSRLFARRLENRERRPPGYVGPEPDAAGRRDSRFRIVSRTATEPSCASTETTTSRTIERP